MADEDKEEKEPEDEQDEEEGDLEEVVEEVNEEIELEKLSDFLDSDEGGEIVEIAPESQGQIVENVPLEQSAGGFVGVRGDDEDKGDISYRVSGEEEENKLYENIGPSETENIALSRGELNSEIETRNTGEIVRQDISNPWQRGDVSVNRNGQGEFRDKTKYVTGGEVEQDREKGWEKEKRKYELK